MAEEKYTKKLELRLEGFQEALDHFLQTGKGLDEVVKKNTEVQKAMDETTAALDRMGDSQGAQKLSDELEQIKKKALEAQAALQRAMEQDIKAGGQGRPEDAVRTLSQDQIQAAIQYANIISGRVVPANRQATKEADQLAQALQKTYGAMSAQQFESSIANLSRMEQAQARLTRAAIQHYDAQQKFNAAEAGQGTHQEKVRAYQEMEKAAQGLQRAEAAVNAEQRKLDLSKQKEQLKISEKLGESMIRLSRMESNRAFEAQIKGLTELEQAQARYLRLVEQEEAARTRVSQSGQGTQEKVRAMEDLEKAVKRTDQAWRGLQSAQKKEDTARLRQEAKDTQELEKSTQRLANARRAAEEAIPQKGADRLAVARRNETRATEELKEAQESYNKVTSNSGSSIQQVTKAQNDLARAQENSTKAQKVLLQEQERAINTLPRLRYALYDVSRTLTRMGAAMTGAAAGVGVVATKMSRDFADVIRTTETFRDETGQTSAALKKNFEDMYSSMPADWADITRLGEMAGQMNIAAGDVAEFTELVTKFAASTDVSVESSATAFGRLSELLNVSADEYENLGSSILSVGVNSVATESQIIEISQQIAGIAGTAGLSADEVIGLSSALASIGTAPELSRGIVTRFFTNLMEATSEGGERLQKFAEVSGMSAAAFQKAWEEDAAGAFQSVIKGLGEVEKSDAIHVLKELGIQQVRDIPAVLKLSQNYELLAHSMGIAADGYAEGSALAEHYGVISEEMSSKIHVLKNQFALLLEALGQFTQTDFFKGLVDMATRALNLLTTLANTKMAQWAGGVTIAVGAVVGGLALLAGGITSAMAASFGLRTALANLIPIMGSSSAAANANSTSLFNLARQMWATQGAANALRATLAGLGVGLALGVVTFAIAKVTENLQKARNAAESFSGLYDAIAADTQAYQAAVDAGEDVANSYRIIKVSARDAATGSDEMSDSLRKILGVTDPVAGGLRDVAGAAEEATIALGKEYAAAVARSIAENEHLINKLDAGADQLAQAGFKVTDFAQAMAQGTAGDYLQGMLENLDQLNAEAGNVPAHLERWGTANRRLVNDFLDAYQAIDILREAAGLTEEELSQLNLTSEITSAVLEDMGLDAESLEEAFNEASGAADGFRSILTDFDTSAHDLQGTFYDLADAIIENGGAFDEFSQEGRASMAALESALEDLWAQGDNAQDFALNMAEMFAYMEGAEISLEGQTDMLRQALISAFGDEWVAHLDTSAAHGSIKNFMDAVIAALKARQEIERSTMARAGLASITAMGAGDLESAQKHFDLAMVAKDNARAISQQISAVEGLSSSLSKAGNAGQQAGRQIRDGLTRGGGGRGGGGRKSPAKKAAEDVKELQKEIYTLKDYASDLSEVWSRAFDIRFSGQATIDTATKSFRDLATRFEEAEQNVRDLRLQLQSLQGDMSGIKAEISKQEYFLSIATEYGDTNRAEQIQARLAELQAELAQKQSETSDTSKELKRAQDDTSRALEGNSDAAIQNRADIRDLVQQYQDHIEALARSGLSSDELKRKTEKLREDFVKQATQLGYNRDEIRKYERGFDDLRVAIEKVPRNITVKANTNPAMQAVNEWLAKVKKKQATMTVKANVSKPKSLGSIGGGQYQPSSIYSRGPLSASTITERKSVTGAGPYGGGRFTPYSTGGKVTETGPIYRASGGPAEWAKMYAKGTDTIPAMLTPGEYVVKKKAVDFYGPEVMRAINNMQVPKRFFSSSGQMGRGSQASGTMSNGQRVTVDLSASSVQAVAHAVRPMLKVGDTVIAGAANRESVNSSSFGRG